MDSRNIVIVDEDSKAKKRKEKKRKGLYCQFIDKVLLFTAYSLHKETKTAKNARKERNGGSSCHVRYMSVE